MEISNSENSLYKKHDFILTEIISVNKNEIIKIDK